MTVLRFSAPVLPMPVNARRGKHWSALSREADDWKLLVPACPLHQRQAVDRPRIVTITFVKTRGPLSDPDNLVGRSKPVLDALVFRKWMIDDAPRYVELDVCEEIGSPAGTRIEVAEIGGHDA